MRHWYAVRKLFRRRAITVVTYTKATSRRHALYFASRSCSGKDSNRSSRQALAMSPGCFYAVRKGRMPGIYHTWKECESQISGFSKPEFKKFLTAAGAEAYMGGDQIDIPVKPVVKSPQASSRGQKRSLTGVTDESQWQVVYTDGACKGNGKIGSMAGVGVFWGPNDPRNLAERCPGDQTNNRAEMIAIIRVLETVPMTKKKLLIKTDSRYSIDCFEQWLPKWMQNDYKTSDGRFVKNAGIIRYLSSLLTERGRRGQQICLQHTKGHSGDAGNDGADAQANIGATLPSHPELDWGTLQSRASELIESLVPKEASTAPVVGTQPQLSESSERPTKMSKNQAIVSQVSADTIPIAFLNHVPTHISVPVMGLAPTRPNRSPLRPNKISSSSPDRPTVYSRPTQAASTPESSAAPVMQPPSSGSSVLPQPQTLPVARLSEALKVTSSPTSAVPRSQSSHARTSGVPKSPLSPKSPLTVSKVAPPLVPVLMCDIDINLYKDCLLEGEDWEREIENI